MVFYYGHYSRYLNYGQNMQIKENVHQVFLSPCICSRQKLKPIEAHVKLCVTEPDFVENDLPPKQGKWAKNWVFLRCSCTNSIFDKIFVPEIWAKMFSVNQIAGFFNQPYLQNKSIKQSDFFHGDTNSHKLNLIKRFLSGHGQNWVWPVWVWNSKIDCISRMN